MTEARAQSQARYYDGRHAIAHAVRVQVADGALAIRAEDDALIVRWPLDRLRGRHDTGPDDDLVLWLPGDPARLVLRDPALAGDIKRFCPDLSRVETDPRLRRSAALFAGATLAAVALLIFVLLPALANRLAPLIPPEREAAFGRAVVGQVSQIFGVEDPDNPFCTDPAGQAALDLLASRLTDQSGLPYPSVSVRVVDGDLVNAFAAPGAQVVLFRGLIEAAQSPDEVAGVLAHEFGHVAARDPTRLALRAAGTAGLLGLLFGDFTGGTVILTLGNRLIAAAYTRDAEAQADDFALDALRSAEISGRGLGDFFARMAEDSGDAPGFLTLLQSHPDLAERAARSRAAPLAGTEPALTPEQWSALQSICDRTDGAAERDEGRDTAPD